MEETNKTEGTTALKRKYTEDLEPPTSKKLCPSPQDSEEFEVDEPDCMSPTSVSPTLIHGDNDPDSDLLLDIDVRSAIISLHEVSKSRRNKRYWERGEGVFRCQLTNNFVSLMMPEREISVDIPISQIKKVQCYVRKSLLVAKQSNILLFFHLEPSEASKYFSSLQKKASISNGQYDRSNSNNILTIVPEKSNKGMLRETQNIIRTTFYHIYEEIEMNEALFIIKSQRGRAEEPNRVEPEQEPESESRKLANLKLQTIISEYPSILPIIKPHDLLLLPPPGNLERPLIAKKLMPIQLPRIPSTSAHLFPQVKSSDLSTLPGNSQFCSQSIAPKNRKDDLNTIGTTQHVEIKEEDDVLSNVDKEHDESLNSTFFDHMSDLNSIKNEQEEETVLIKEEDIKCEIDDADPLVRDDMDHEETTRYQLAKNSTSLTNFLQQFPSFSNFLLHCSSITIGSYVATQNNPPCHCRIIVGELGSKCSKFQMVPNGPTVSKLVPNASIQLYVPNLSNSDFLDIPYSEIDKVLAHFGEKRQVICLFLKRKVCTRIRHSFSWAEQLTNKQNWKQDVWSIFGQIIPENKRYITIIPVKGYAKANIDILKSLLKMWTFGEIDSKAADKLIGANSENRSLEDIQSVFITEDGVKCEMEDVHTDEDVGAASEECFDEKNEVPENIIFGIKPLVQEDDIDLNQTNPKPDNFIIPINSDQSLHSTPSVVLKKPIIGLPIDVAHQLIFTDDRRTIYKEQKESFLCQSLRIGSYAYASTQKANCDITKNGIEIKLPNSFNNELILLKFSTEQVINIMGFFGRWQALFIFLNDTACEYINEKLSPNLCLWPDNIPANERHISILPDKDSWKGKVTHMGQLFGDKFVKLDLHKANEILMKNVKLGKFLPPDTGSEFRKIKPLPFNGERPLVKAAMYPKPACTYRCLVGLAIKSSLSGCMKTVDICNFISLNFPFYGYERRAANISDPKNWKLVIHSTLYNHECFKNMMNMSGKGQGKSAMWRISPEIQWNINDVGNVGVGKRSVPQSMNTFLNNIKVAMFYPHLLEKWINNDPAQTLDSIQHKIANSNTIDKCKSYDTSNSSSLQIQSLNEEHKSALLSNEIFKSSDLKSNTETSNLSSDQCDEVLIEEAIDVKTEEEIVIKVEPVEIQAIEDKVSESRQNFQKSLENGFNNITPSAGALSLEVLSIRFGCFEMSTVQSIKYGIRTGQPCECVITPSSVTMGVPTQGDIGHQNSALNIVDVPISGIRRVDAYVGKNRQILFLHINPAIGQFIKDVLAIKSNDDLELVTIIPVKCRRTSKSSLEKWFSMLRPFFGNLLNEIDLPEATGMLRVSIDYKSPSFARKNWTIS